MASCQELYLDNNQIGDVGLTALASVLGSGALDKLEILQLSDNQIGNQGMVELSEALGKGALDKIENIFLFGNPGNSEPVDKVLRERKK